MIDGKIVQEIAQNIKNFTPEELVVALNKSATTIEALQDKLMQSEKQIESHWHVLDQTCKKLNDAAAELKRLKEQKTA